MNNDIEKLLELIEKVVNTPKKTWEEKRDAVLAEASTEQTTSLTEFCAWF